MNKKTIAARRLRWTLMTTKAATKARMAPRDQVMSMVNTSRTITAAYMLVLVTNCQMPEAGLEIHPTPRFETLNEVSHRA